MKTAYRQHLIDASGLPFTEAGVRAVLALAVPDVKRLIADLLEQQEEMDWLIWRDGEIYQVGDGEWPIDPNFLKGAVLYGGSSGRLRIEPREAA